jgi:hypothetical protein
MTDASGRSFYLGLAIGQIWLTLSSTGGVSFLGAYGGTPADRAIRFGLVALGAVVLLAGSVALLRAARQLPSDGSAEFTARRRRMGRTFGLIVLAEVVVIAAANVVLIATGNAIWIVPFAALVVGLHFIPLAFVFHVRPYVVLGVLWVLVVAAVVVTVPESAGGPGGVRQWVALICIGCGLTTWLVVVFNLLWSFVHLRQARQAVASSAGA